MPIVNVMQEHELKNAYIGEYGWQPWANTVAYYPLTATDTVNDKSWNNRNLTNNWTQFWTYAGVSCVYCTWWNFLYYSSNPITWNSSFTAVARFYNTQRNSSRWENVLSLGDTDWNNAFSMGINNSWYTLMVWWWNNDRNTWYTVPLNSWILCVMSHSSGTIKTYVNWSLINTSTVNFNLSSSKMRVGAWLWNSPYQDAFYGYISNVIFENKARTATEISDYYNQTKSNYWL
jgi:hypothetical protein